MRRLRWITPETNIAYERTYGMVLEMMADFVNWHKSTACKSKEGGGCRSQMG